MYKKVNHSKCQLESYTRPVPNKAANSKFELNKLNFSNISNIALNMSFVDIITTQKLNMARCLKINIHAPSMN